MSCDVAAAVFALHLASFSPAPPAADPAWLMPASASTAVNPLAGEPLFASIVDAATRLEGRVDGWRRAALPSVEQLVDLKAQVSALSALDMQGHLELAKRGTDGDLKCILRGISQDLPRKLDQVAAAPTPASARSAAEELYYLLRDNVEVVTSPAHDSSTDVVKPAL